ncbi:MAG: prepilin-type N-terminal cleavage/methylation domain-containing protein [bacterium]
MKLSQGTSSQGTSPQGFTLIEVILAMGVLTSTVFIISGLMLRSFLRVQENRDDIEIVFLIKRELYANYFNPPKDNKKNVQKIEEPAITITSKLDEINKKSSLCDLSKNLRIVRSDAIWKMNNNIRESAMVSFIFRPKKEEQKQ